MELLDPSTTHAFRTALEKALRPRDETLDHHQFHEQVLAQTYGDTILRHPLALLSPDVGAASRPADEQATPSRLEELIDTNIRLNKELRQLQEASRTGPDSSDVGSAPTTTKPNAGQAAPDVQDGEVIALQLQVNALEEKRSRLGIFLGALDRLETLPAAEPEFLQPSAVFHACSPLPEMPGALMEGFTRDNSAPQHEVETMMRGLHKAVLRNKLLAQREKRKLDAMRKQGVGGGGLADPSALPAEVQLHALTAVKDHLIGWIEAQLMEAGDEEEEEGDDDNDGGRNGGSGLPQRSLGTAAKTSSQKGEVDLDTQLADIQREYSEHINLRKEVAMLLAETEGVNHELEQFRGMRIAEDAAPPQQSSKPPASLPPSSALDPPAMLMLTPYLEKLQASAREQKALVQEKSHINSAVTRQQQHMSQVIHDLVEESQLLRAYPNATALDATNHRGSRRSSSNTRRSFADATRRGGSTTSKTSVSKQVEPFVYAADSAKIATLEAVVDKIELGQMAVDEAMGRLGEVRRFLNKPDDDKDGDDADTRVNRRHSVQMQAAQGHRRRITEGKIIIADQHEKSIWSKLDGNLGLIND